MSRADGLEYTHDPTEGDYPVGTLTSHSNIAVGVGSSRGDSSNQKDYLSSQDLFFPSQDYTPKYIQPKIDTRYLDFTINLATSP